MLRRRTITLGLVAVASASAAIAKASERDTPQALVESAHMAMGLGAHSSKETYELRTLRISGAIKQWSPGESRSVADPSEPDSATSTFSDTWDRTRDSWRTDWVRPKFVSGTRNYSEVYTRAGGYLTGMDVNYGLPQRTIQSG